MNSEFAIQSERINDTLIMSTSGYINNSGGEQIVGEYSRYENQGINRVIMDLKSSKVINSIGVSYLIEVIEKLSQINGKMIFTNLDPAIEKTFRIMGLFQFAEKAETLESAMIV